jgi:outer membrane protein OmpA-like peptidoglycan-associated protein
MRRFTAAGGALLVGAILVVSVGVSGCCTPPPPSRDGLLVEPPPEAPWQKNVYQEPAPREPKAAPKVVPEPPPPPPPPAAVPPAVVAAIEDLGQKYPGLFVFNKETGQFRFNADITFDSGSNIVKPQARIALARLAQILNADQARDRMLTIVGHTDADRVRKPDTIARLKALGKPADNMGLSEARAEAVAEVLKAGGIDAARVVTHGRGETEPIADNRSAAGKARNRRVEIFLTAMGGPAGGRTAPLGRVSFPSGK